MHVQEFVRALGSAFYTGVPDSQLKALCDYLLHHCPAGAQHLIAPNEGSCMGLAAGYHLATGKVPVVYMQNSGIGNAINPITSLCNDKVYGIPCIFVIGWRGEPGLHDEPQHVFQGQITLSLLETLDIASCIVSADTTVNEVKIQLAAWQSYLAQGKQVAFVVRKGALTLDTSVTYQNAHTMTREQAIGCVLEVSGDDPMVSTTGKASRELFELREAKGQTHEHDFLTVGSMGHSASIALGIALHQRHQKVWCVDGDGAVLMHMGTLAMLGTCRPQNLVHIIINNGAHESVGGMPTVGEQISLCGVAQACGYPHTVCVDNPHDLAAALHEAKARDALSLIEVRCAIGARADLGRPTTTAQHNKEQFMRTLQA